ncbi:hypothetical protein UFOVP868_45 [uncultured Caudovirales phage]|uniref:Uncharacterized protein n=1 Tax=uncultured Caudovirales phage TaxID=2100421 RepID=A0A6J5PE49_9CAUD|nr:hypothetical protein UFOVP868_45 [uncultured Caudovirales phage]
MPKFDVDVQGSTYEVDAPNERTAWAWANAEHRKPTVGRESEIVGGTILENAPSAIGTGLGGILGGTGGTFITPGFGTVAGSIAGGYAGEKATEGLADLATRYLTGDQDTTYRKYIQSKFAQPASEEERALKSGVGAVTEIAPSLLSGKIVTKIPAAFPKIKGAATKAGEMLSASPIGQLVASGTGAVVSEVTDNPLLGLAAGLATNAPKSILDRAKFPKPAAAKTLSDWAQVRDNAYDQLKNSGIVLKDRTTQTIGNKLINIINREGYDPKFQTLMTPVVDSIQEKIQKGKIDFKELKELGENINSKIREAYSKDPPQAERLRKVNRGLNELIDNLLPSDFSTGGRRINFVRDTLKEAKEATKKVAKMKIVNNILEIAENSEDVSEIPKSFKKLSKDLYEMKQFSNEEKTAIRNLAKGKLDALGSLLPGTTTTGRIAGAGGYGAAATALAALGFPVVAGITATLGTTGAAAKKTSEYLKPKAAKALSELISRGYAPPKFSWGKAMGPSAIAASTGAAEPDEQPEQKAVGGLASLKKRYG